MTHQDYMAAPGVNWSLLKELAKSPAHYKHRLANPRTDTAAMQLGRLVHCAVLEPDALPERYAVWPGTRRGREWAAFEVAEIDAGKEIVTAAEYERALAIRDAVRGHPVAGKLLVDGEAEVTRTWTDAATGIACKCRIDYLSYPALVDLKTASDISPHAFARSCAKYQYHGQLSFYARSVPDAPVYMVAVESEPPHDCVVYAPDEDFLWAGDELVTELLTLLDKCQRNATWPGRFDAVQPLSLPAWVFSELEDATSLGVSFRKGDA